MTFVHQIICGIKGIGSVTDTLRTNGANTVHVKCSLWFDRKWGLV